MTMNNMTDMQGRSYFVTGGGSGIGAAIAEELASRGAAVAVAGRRVEKLDEVVARIAASGGRAVPVQVDVRDPEQVQAAVDRAVSELGGLDGLVNNAAGNFVCPAEKLSPNGWRAVVDIVLNGTWNCTSAVAQHMIATERPGSILSVIATYAWTGHPGTVHSAAAKAGVLTMSRTLAAEWARFGIRVNCIAPGPTTTEGAGAALWADDQQRAAVIDSVPARRFASPEEIARVSGFLMSDHATYVTGEVLTVDGGQSLGRQVYGPPVVPAAADGLAGAGR